MRSPVTILARATPAMIGAVLCCAPMIGSAADPSAPPGAESVLSTSEIQRALQAPPKTRGFVPRGLTRRGTEESEQSVNLNIPFEHDSSALKPQASQQLLQLESALRSAVLEHDRFIVAGHTDAKGSPQYNKLLSLRRAQAVKNFLVAKGVSAARLDTVGYGSQKLLQPDQPTDPRNRRVEIRDLGRAP